MLLSPSVRQADENRGLPKEHRLTRVAGCQFCHPFDPRGTCAACFPVEGLKSGGSSAIDRLDIMACVPDEPTRGLDCA